LSLASPEVKFKLDAETNSPLDVGMYELRETNMMVEEMMLMANITVATHIHKSFPSCAVLRRHETPTPEMFKPLQQVPSPRLVHMHGDTARCTHGPWFRLCTYCSRQPVQVC
jgi:exosome complex exonuclease DIS3/RRP44